MHSRFSIAFRPVSLFALPPPSLVALVLRPGLRLRLCLILSIINGRAALLLDLCGSVPLQTAPEWRSLCFVPCAGASSCCRRKRASRYWSRAHPASWPSPGMQATPMPCPSAMCTRMESCISTVPKAAISWMPSAATARLLFASLAKMRSSLWNTPPISAV